MSNSVSINHNNSEQDLMVEISSSSTNDNSGSDNNYTENSEMIVVSVTPPVKGHETNVSLSQTNNKVPNTTNMSSTMSTPTTPPHGMLSNQPNMVDLNQLLNEAVVNLTSELGEIMQLSEKRNSSDDKQIGNHLSFLQQMFGYEPNAPPMTTTTDQNSIDNTNISSEDGKSDESVRVDSKKCETRDRTRTNVHMGTLNDILSSPSFTTLLSSTIGPQEGKGPTMNLDYLFDTIKQNSEQPLVQDESNTSGLHSKKELGCLVLKQFVREILSQIGLECLVDSFSIEEFQNFSENAILPTATALRQLSEQKVQLSTTCLSVFASFCAGYLIARAPNTNNIRQSAKREMHSVAKPVRKSSSTRPVHQNYMYKSTDHPVFAPLRFSNHTQEKDILYHAPLVHSIRRQTRVSRGRRELSRRIHRESTFGIESERLYSRNEVLTALDNVLNDPEVRAYLRRDLESSSESEQDAPYCPGCLDKEELVRSESVANSDESENDQLLHQYQPQCRYYSQRQHQPQYRYTQCQQHRQSLNRNPSFVATLYRK